MSNSTLFRSSRSMAILFMLTIFLMIGQIASQCLTPLTAFGNSTIAPPVLDASATGFISNPDSTNENNTRALAVRITWATVGNRILTYAGIGDDSVSPGCQPHVLPVSPANQANGGWFINTSSSDCFSEIMANYSWPEALYSQTCAPLFTVDTSDPDFDKISFDLIVKFNETYTITRGSLTFSQVKTIAAKLPITLQFPRAVTVDSSAVRVFSASSIEVSADLISQDVTNNPPFAIRFITLNGRSFALDQPTMNYSGPNPQPLSKPVTFEEDTILGTTRQSTWRMSITPDPSACTLSGEYGITFNLYWTGVDANGNPLAENQNPLPNNSTVTVTFTIASQDFCATVLTQALTATLRVFDQPPSTTTFYNGVQERLGFFTRARIYFQAQVTSENLPILSTTLTRFWITWSSTNTTDLVDNASPVLTSIDFQLSVPLAQQPRDQSLFNMLLAEDVFQVLQDQDTDYVFHALLSITYSTTGSKKRALIELNSRPMNAQELRMMGALNSNPRVQNYFGNNEKNFQNNSKMRALPVSGSTSVTATKTMTLQATEETTTPAPTNPIIRASSSASSSSVIGSLFLASLFAFLILL